MKTKTLLVQSLTELKTSFTMLKEAESSLEMVSYNDFDAYDELQDTVAELRSLQASVNRSFEGLKAYCLAKFGKDTDLEHWHLT